MNIQEYLIEMRAYAKVYWVPIMREDTEKFLVDLLKEIKPKNILELGTAIGYSSIIFSNTLNDNVIIDTYEIDKQRIGEAKKHFKNLNKNNINIYEGDALKLLKDNNKEYDFIFIDANKSRILDYFNEALRLSNENTSIVIDNVALDGATFSDFYPDHKHRTSIFRMREFVKLLNITPENNKSIMEYKDKKLDINYYDIGDGLILIN